MSSVNEIIEEASRYYHQLAPHVKDRQGSDILKKLIHVVSYGGQLPIPMILHCPRCGFQHIDHEDATKGWANPPHKSHLCEACGYIWRPCDHPTVGVETIHSVGTADSIDFRVPQEMVRQVR